MEKGPEGIPCHREPAKQVGREYACPRVAGSKGGEKGWHDTDSLRAWHYLPPANLCKWRLLTPGRWDVGGWVLSEFGWQPTACSKNGAAAAVVVTARGAGKFSRAPQEHCARTTYPVSCLARRAEKQPIRGKLPSLPWPNGIALTALPSLALLLSTPSLRLPGMIL